MKRILLFTAVLLAGCANDISRCVDAGGLWFDEGYGWKGGICSMPGVPLPPKNMATKYLGRSNLGRPRISRFERGYGYGYRR